ncbi:MAG: hypothetical protein ACYC6K_10815 [Bellilinea sp.]
MKNKFGFTIAVIVIAAVIISCNLPISAATSKPAAAETVAPAAEIQAEPAATAAPVYAAARLTTEDLPEGFRELTAEELEALGFSSDQFTNAFAGMLSEAQPENFAAFTNTNGSFEVIISVLMAPLSALERPVVDLYLRDPQRLANDFSAAGGITGLVHDERSQLVGEASNSVVFSVPDAPLKMTGGLTVARRGEVLQIALLFYPNGAQPALASYAIAEIVDGKLANLE